ncbi:putative secreted oxidoreductase [Streptomyces sp. L-9-10]|nr:putative secreted oxidoreductase [Streptomyces sp. L-9-10]
MVVEVDVVGTMHAWKAVERGHEVVRIEREAEACGVSLRDSGRIWVSGRTRGGGQEPQPHPRELASMALIDHEKITGLVQK